MNKSLLLALLLTGLCFADLVIPSDQPVCRLYNMLQVFGTVAGILVAAYAGFILASTHELTERNAAKALLSGVVIGLVIIWLAPVLVKNLVNSSGICGW